MSAAPIRLSPSLPVDVHFNGLLGQVSRFISTPDEPVFAVIQLGAIRLVKDIATGAQVPVVGVQAVELSCRAVSEATLRELLEAARQERVGFRTLPFEAEVDGLIRGDDR